MWREVGVMDALVPRYLRGYRGMRSGPRVKFRLRFGDYAYAAVTTHTLL